MLLAAHMLYFGDSLGLEGGGCLPAPAVRSACSYATRVPARPPASRAAGPPVISLLSEGPPRVRREQAGAGWLPCARGSQHARSLCASPRPRDILWPTHKGAAPPTRPLPPPSRLQLQPGGGVLPVGGVAQQHRGGLLAGLHAPARAGGGAGSPPGCRAVLPGSGTLQGEEGGLGLGLELELESGIGGALWRGLHRGGEVRRHGGRPAGPPAASCSAPGCCAAGQGAEPRLQQGRLAR